MPSTRHVMDILERRQQVASLYLQRKMQSEIARQLGVTQAQISYDLKAVREMWLASSVRAFDAAKAQELAKIDEAERAYWQGWQRSLEPREVSVTEQTQGDTTSRKASVRREGQAGDPRFLDGVLKCIERRCGILGLEAPKKFSFDWDSLSDEQLTRLAQGEAPLQVMAEA